MYGVVDVDGGDDDDDDDGGGDDVLHKSTTLDVENEDEDILELTACRRG